MSPNAHCVLFFINNTFFLCFSGIETDTSGLGSLSWLIPKAQCWTIGHLRSTGMNVLLKQIEEAFNYAINNDLRKSRKK